MNKIKKILACIDLSSYSLMTLGYALNLAKGAEAQIVVLNVINQRDINGVEVVGTSFLVNINTGDYVRELKKKRTQSLKQLIKKSFFDEKSIMSVKIELGIPSECILKVSETEHVDLVVMANKGKGNLSRVLFGSTAEKVFRHSQVPVFSVRDKNKFKRDVNIFE